MWWISDSKVDCPAGSAAACAPGWRGFMSPLGIVSARSCQTWQAKTGGTLTFRPIYRDYARIGAIRLP
jgi:hypothetical protein